MKTISIIIPAFNEEKNIPLIYAELQKILSQISDEYSFEIVFINDGSSDGTMSAIKALSELDENIKYLDFSRNFGKEIATTAGLNSCAGDASIVIDADLQHPPEVILKFIEKWEAGAEVVVGVRNKNKSDDLIKVVGSTLFYSIINMIAEIPVTPNSTDFRLLDRKVIDEFNRFSETGSMTRALIDWLGFRREFVPFDARRRINGTASYSFWRLFKLAMNSFVSLSLFPLKLAGYFGIVITLISGVSGAYILLGKYFLHTAFASTFSDAENLAIFIVFLVGIILMSVGLIALYVASIHREVIRRPVYVVREKKL